MTSITDGAGATTTYAYDKDSTSITDEDGRRSTSAYDDLDRIVEETHPGEEPISYDAAGNRASMTEETDTTDYTYDAAERMTSAGNTNYSHDANGNLTSRTDQSGTTNYSYDFEDRLVRADDTSYTYDAFGRPPSMTSKTLSTSCPPGSSRRSATFSSSPGTRAGSRGGWTTPRRCVGLHHVKSAR